ncbi:hypothetical protein [Sorangium sp. So ce1078]|uniref:hypothetical protein n=1 Tax=Sorangium sp. So ce1078 TaxID=3133329 RepID=UPI003F5E7727
MGSSNNVCTSDDPQCFASKVTVNVPADSVYIARISTGNVTYDFHSAYASGEPSLGYSFRIY